MIKERTKYFVSRISSLHLLTLFMLQEVAVNDRGISYRDRKRLSTKQGSRCFRSLVRKEIKLAQSRSWGCRDNNWACRRRELLDVEISRQSHSLFREGGWD